MRGLGRLVGGPHVRLRRDRQTCMRAFTLLSACVVCTFAAPCPPIVDCAVESSRPMRVLLAGSTWASPLACSRHLHTTVAATTIGCKAGGYPI